MRRRRPAPRRGVDQGLQGRALPALVDGADWADQIISAWGVHGAHLDRGLSVAAQLAAGAKPLYHLGLSKAGHPRHPLYLPYTQEPVLWQP